MCASLRLGTGERRAGESRVVLTGAAHARQALTRIRGGGRRGRRKQVEVLRMSDGDIEEMT